jgi:hypothetical protein
MRFEDICEDMAVRYVGCPPSVLGEDPCWRARSRPGGRPASW